MTKLNLLSGVGLLTAIAGVCCYSWPAGMVVGGLVVVALAELTLLRRGRGG